MHLFLIVSTLCLIYLIRLVSKFVAVKYQQSWGLVLFFFAFPPLILLMTCVTIVCMGYQGEMWGIRASKFSYILAILFILYSLFTLTKTSLNHYRSCHKIAQYPTKSIFGYDYKFINISFPYAAQIGFVRSHLVISKGLIELLSEEHLKAVIAHELAHEKYKDTFLFFWLFYLKQVGFLLPNNDDLWQNLVLLRELRADKKASETVDFMLIAESLLKVALAVNNQEKFNQLGFDCAFDNYRLQTRIDSLINDNDSVKKINYLDVIWLVLILTPWLFFPFHNPC